MTSTDRKQSRSEFLGPPPLSKNDDEEHYKALQEQVKEYIGPVDFLGDLAVREITDAIWEGQRYKKCQSALIDSAFHEALIQALTRIHQNADWLARNQADQWFRGTSEERRRRRRAAGTIWYQH
jgi:hypothetical protein